MGCLITGTSILIPRTTMFFILIFTNWFSLAFHTAIWPILGFIFMPYTTLAYMAGMINNSGTIDGMWLVLVVVAVFCDLGSGTYEVKKRTE